MFRCVLVRTLQGDDGALLDRWALLARPQRKAPARLALARRSAGDVVDSVDANCLQNVSVHLQADANQGTYRNGLYCVRRVMTELGYGFSIRPVENEDSAMIATADNRSSAFAEDGVPWERRAPAHDWEVANGNGLLEAEDSDSRIDVVDENLRLLDVPRREAPISREPADAIRVKARNVHFLTHGPNTVRYQPRLHKTQVQAVWSNENQRFSNSYTAIFDTHSTPSSCPATYSASSAWLKERLRGRVFSSEARAIKVSTLPSKAKSRTQTVVAQLQTASRRRSSRTTPETAKISVPHPKRLLRSSVISN
jgi:hypothetical protein